ncbi:MAG: hypothetical protein EOP06_24755 [Proteobacteria bacterium]|nr:MAG: hypothetical protein EOP06_24755 [Pseudomonadota bacterium]
MDHSFHWSDSKMRRLLLTTWLLFILPLTSQAQSFTGPIAGGTGGAGRAAVDPSESAFLNPATAAYFQRYIFGGFYQMGEVDSQRDFSSYAVQVSDGTPTNLISGALSYVHNSVDLVPNSGAGTGGNSGDCS